MQNQNNKINERNFNFMRKLKKILISCLLCFSLLPSNIKLSAASPIVYLDEKWNQASDTTYPWVGSKEITGDGHLLLKSSTSTNSLIAFSNITFPDTFTYEFRAKINQYGPDNRSNNSLATKIEVDNTHRLMFTIEENGLYGCNTSSTWTKLSDFKAGNEMHTYRFEFSKATMRADLYIDNTFMTTIQLQKGAYNTDLQYWVNGTSSKPAQAEIDYTKIYYDAPSDSIPFWSLSDHVEAHSTLDGITLNWDEAQGNVDAYHIYKDDIQIATVRGDVTQYQCENLPSSSPYYTFKIEAVNANGETSNGPSIAAKTSYDTSSDVLDISNVFDHTKASKYTFGYRIPGLVVTNENTLLAYTEARKTGSDWAPMDLLMKRSVDGGETWEEIVVVAGLDENLVINNPVMIVGSDNTIHLLYCVEYGVESLEGGVFYRKSVDDGKTWSEASDVSASFYTPEYKRSVVATGPGHGIQLQDGTLIVPIWMAYQEGNPTSHQPSVVSTIYSKDNGETWQMGEVIFATNDVPNPNETVITQLNNGDVMLNIRNTSSQKRRAVSISSTGYDNWSTPVLDDTLVDPVCFGSITRYDENTLLFVNANSSNSRTNGTVRASFDEGKTWSVSNVIDAGSYAYSDIAVDKNKTIYVLYESQTNSTSSLKLARFSMDWVNDAKKGKLESLTCSNGEFNTPFQPDLYRYTINVDKDTSDLNLFFQAAFENSFIYVNGELCTTGTIPVHMDTPQKEINIKVVNGDRSFTYTIRLKQTISEKASVAYYNFDEDNDTTITDQTYRGNDLTNHDTKTGTGLFDNGMVFDNDRNYLSIDHTNELNFGTNDFTVSMWINPTSLTGTKIFAWYGTSGGKQWWFRQTNGILEFCLSSNGSESVLKTNAAVLKQNEWQHVSVVRHGFEQAIYLNGEKLASKTTNTLFDVNGEDTLYIGKAKANDARLFQGHLDELRFYKYALNDQEIMNLANSTEAVNIPWDSHSLTYVLGLIDVTDETLSDQQIATLTTYQTSANSLLDANIATPEFISQLKLDDYALEIFNYLNEQSLITGNKDDLTNLVQEELDLTLYEDGAEKQAYLLVLAQAKSLLLQPAPSFTSIHAMYVELLQAKAALTPIPNTSSVKTILKNVTDKAQQLTNQMDHLAPNVKAMIQKRLDEANAVYMKNTASDEECLTAWLNLANALQYMDFIANKQDLNTLITECEQIDTSEYTSGVEAFEFALQHAKEVYENPDVLQNTIDETYKALYRAKSGLTNEGIDQTILISLITKIEETIGDGTNYVHNDAWDTFQTVLVEAKALITKDQVTQEEINTMILRLSNSYENIRLHPDEALLQELHDFIDLIHTIDFRMYRDSDVTFLINTRSNVSNLINKINEASDEEITKVKEELTMAMLIINNNKIETITPNIKDKEPTDATKDKLDTSSENMVVSQTSRVKTGDIMNTFGYHSLLLVSLAAITRLLKKRKHE